MGVTNKMIINVFTMLFNLNPMSKCKCAATIKVLNAYLLLLTATYLNWFENSSTKTTSSIWER